MHKKLEMSVRYPNTDIQQAVRSTALWSEK